MDDHRIDRTHGLVFLTQIPQPDTRQHLHCLRQACTALEYIEKSSHPDELTHLATMLASVQRQLVHASNDSGPQPFVAPEDHAYDTNIFLLPGPFCHREVLVPAVVQRNGKFQGHVYGHPNTDIKATEVPMEVKRCWHPSSRAKYGSFGHVTDSGHQCRKLSSAFFNSEDKPEDFEERFSHPLCVVLVREFGLSTNRVTQACGVSQMMGFYLFMCEQRDIRQRLKTRGWSILLDARFSDYIRRYIESFPKGTTAKTLQNTLVSICGSRLKQTASFMSTITSRMPAQQQRDAQSIRMAIHSAAWFNGIWNRRRTHTRHRKAEVNNHEIHLLRVWVIAQRRATDLTPRLAKALSNAINKGGARSARYETMQGQLLFILSSTCSVGCFRTGELHDLKVFPYAHLPANESRGVTLETKTKSISYRFNRDAAGVKVNTAGLGPSEGYVWPPSVSQLIRRMARLNGIMCLRRWGKQSPANFVYLFPDLRTSVSAQAINSISRRQGREAVKKVLPELKRGAIAFKLRHAACTFSGWVMSLLTNGGRSALWWRVREMLAVLMRHTLSEELSTYDHSKDKSAVKKAWNIHRKTQNLLDDRRFIDLQTKEPLYFHQASWVGRLLRNVPCVTSEQGASMFPSQLLGTHVIPDALKKFCLDKVVFQIRAKVGGSFQYQGQHGDNIVIGFVESHMLFCFCIVQIRRLMPSNAEHNTDPVKQS